MTKLALSGAALAALCMSAAPAVGWGDEAPTSARAAEVLAQSRIRPAARFKCTDGGELKLWFSEGEGDFYAVVDPGDGPHALMIQAAAATDASPVITWSDGSRRLEWHVNVQLMWIEGATHRHCSRGDGEHDHGGPPEPRSVPGRPAAPMGPSAPRRAPSGPVA